MKTRLLMANDRGAISALPSDYLGSQNVTDLFIGHREIVLPSGVIGVDFGEAVSDGPTRSASK